VCFWDRSERLSECRAIVGLAGSGNEARRAGALPECSRIEGRTRGRRRQSWMGERTRVVVMSRAQANCCRLLSTSLCKSTEVHGTGGREPFAFLPRWVLLSTARLQEVVTRSFSLARPSLAALFFVCSQARRGGSRDGARGEAATAPTAICPGVVGGRRYYEEGSHGAQVAFFSRSPRASAPSLTAGGGSCVSRLGMDIGRADRAISVPGFVC